MSSFWNSPAWTMGKKVKASTKKTGIPIPGPGNYNSSVNIGKHNPAWKIGQAERDGLRLNDAPGPGEYNLPNSKSGPKITMSSKGKANSLGDGLHPGPGNYNVLTDGVYKNTSAFTMGAKYSNKIDDPQPGPGAYNSSTQFKHIGAKIGKSKRDGLQDGNKNPGPGQYPQSRPFSAGPKYGFGNQSKSTSNLDLKPGPGQYQVGFQVVSQGKGCIIGQKFNNKFNKNSSPGPGYYEMNSKRPQSGTKIGKASRITYNADCVPGPGAYDQSYNTKKWNEIKIGTSLRNDIGRIPTPGPGSYQYNKNSGKGITISGYKGKNQIEITPGPGAYQLATQEIKRPCSAKIGKGQRSNLGLNDTPGPGQYYPYDTVNYKFAYTKELRSKDLKGGQPGPGQYSIPPTVPSAPHYLIDPHIFKSYA